MRINIQVIFVTPFRCTLFRNSIIGLLILLSQSVNSLSLSEPEVRSLLGSPLKVRIEIRNFGDLDAENIQVTNAEKHYYETLGVPESIDARGLNFKVTKVSEDLYLLNITSNHPIKEPYVNLLVHLRWPDGELIREISLLLDTSPIVSK